MKTNFTLLLSFFLFCCFSMNGQQVLVDHFEGIKTSMNITTTDSVTLNSDIQYLVKRPSINFNYESDGESTYTTKYAYETIHLEFKSKKKIVTTEEKGRRKHKIYILTFYEKDDYQILEKRIPERKVKFYDMENMYEPDYYSIDLGDIPLMLLEDVARIDILLIEYSFF